MLDFKQQVLNAIDMESEFISLLGSPQWSGGEEKKFRCPNKAGHKNLDANASLCANMRTGFYDCKACDFKGDIFTLFAFVHGVNRRTDFSSILKALATKYGVQKYRTRVDRKRAITAKVRGPKTINKTSPQREQWAASMIRIPESTYLHLLQNYGITKLTVHEWGLGWRSNRLWIPIPSLARTKPITKTELINIRKHDTMRRHCEWIDKQGNIYRTNVANSKPTWKTGKTIGVKGHNANYIYPMEVIPLHREIYLVGGELKALLLNQLGIPAVTFTAGEGKYPKHMLKHFLGKIVHVLMDIDVAGESATFGYKDKKGNHHPGLAEILANNGAAEVYGCRLPKEGLPETGDITDYLRLHGWNVDAMNNLERIKIEPKEAFSADPEDLLDIEREPTPEWETVKLVKFEDMLQPKYSDNYIRVPYVVAGRNDTPYMIPWRVVAICEAGMIQGDPTNRCSRCTLKLANYEKVLELTPTQRVAMAGQPANRIRANLIKALRMPKCEYPELNIEDEALERVVVIPTLDATHSGDQFNYRQQGIWVEGSDYQLDNSAYEAIGKVVANPKDSTFTFIAEKHRNLDNDIFAYRFDESKHNRLRDVLRRGRSNQTIQEVIKDLIKTLVENKFYKYGVDTMILYQLLAFFMPFEFDVGQYKNYKLCPEVCILGETRTGKSSVAKDILTLYGAGRYVDAATTTAVGLIGGATTYNKNSMFTWGVLPMCNRAVCVLDESNKLPYQTLDMLTNLRSAGIAERSIAGNIRKIRALIRFLWIANPRAGKELRMYSNPVRAAQELFGTPQDLARLDLLHIQHKQTDMSLVNVQHQSRTDDYYTKDMARYHLQWAWSLRKEDVNIEDPSYLLLKTLDLLRDFRSPILQPAEAKFKVARVAAGLAALAFQYDEHRRCLVNNEAVDLSIQLLSNMMGAKEESDELLRVPFKLRKIFINLKFANYPKLNFFLKKDATTTAEMGQLFGIDWTSDFLMMTYFDDRDEDLKGLVEMRAKFWVWDNRLRDYVRSFLEEWKRKKATG